MITYQQIAEACRNNDAFAEEHGFAGAVGRAGLDPAEAQAAAEQRGLRAALLATGDEERLNAFIRGNRPIPADLSPEQKRLTALFGAAFLDGFCAAQQIKEVE